MQKCRDYFSDSWNSWSLSKSSCGLKCLWENNS